MTFPTKIASELRAHLENCWDADTSAYPAWTAEQRSKGQCAVTAAIVQDILGGDIMRAVVDGDSHYWNSVLADGVPVEVDLTRDQFPVWIPFEQAISSRERIMSHPATVARYELLRSRLHHLIGNPDLMGTALHSAA